MVEASRKEMIGAWLDCTLYDRHVRDKWLRDQASNRRSLTAAPIELRTSDREPSGSSDIELLSMETWASSSAPAVVYSASCTRIIFAGCSILNRCCKNGGPQCSSINTPHKISDPSSLTPQSLAATHRPFALHVRMFRAAEECVSKSES
jgi:hypothetical protein